MESAHRSLHRAMDYRRPMDGPLPSSMPPPGLGRPPPPSSSTHPRPLPPSSSAAAPPPRPIPPSSLPSLSSGQGFYTVESLQNATVVPPPQLLPPPRLLPSPSPEPFHLPERPFDRFDPPRPRSQLPDDRAFAPPLSMSHTSRLDRGRPPVGRELPPHRDLPPRNFGPMIRGGPRMRRPPPPFLMDPRMAGFHHGRDGRGRGWPPARDFGFGRRMDRGRPMQSLGVRRTIQKTKSLPRAKASLSAAIADKKISGESQEQVEGGPGWCTVCQINCFRAETLNKHLAGKRHKRQLEKLSGEPEEPNQEGEEVFDEPEELKELEVEVEVMNETDNAIDNSREEKAELNNEDMEAPEAVKEIEHVEAEDIEDPKEVKEIEQVEAAGVAKVETPAVAKKRVIRDKDGGVATKKRQKPSVSSNAQSATITAAGENEGKIAGTENSKMTDKGSDVVEVCQLCNVTCNSKAILENHLKGKKHAARLKKTNSLDSKDAVGENVGVTPGGDLANGIAGQSA